MKHRSLAIVLLLAALAGTAGLYGIFSGARNPAEAVRLHARARSLEREGKTDDALACFRAALARDPESVPINRDYQNLMRRAGRIEEARAEYRKRAANMPKSAGAQYLAARLEDGETLEKGMRRALDLDADFVWAHRALGTYCSDHGRVDEAATHFERAAGCREATVEDAGTLLALLYKTRRFADIDRVLASWLSRRPAFCKPDEAVASVAIGKLADDWAMQLHFAVDPSAPLLYAIRIERKDDMFRQISVRRSGSGFAVAWTGEWLRSGETGGAPETWERAERPAFAEVHAEALKRSGRDEK